MNAAITRGPAHADRHKELREQANKRGLDSIPDPRSQHAATIGGFTDGLDALPWGILACVSPVDSYVLEMKNDHEQRCCKKA